MTHRARSLLACVAFVFGVGTLALAQISLEPTPAPLVIADNESWYLNGTPLTFAGNIYYPTGPLVHFSQYEMYRSGFFQGIPLYSRHTLEPYSIVFVPLRGGLMHPYERRRAGDIAGTVGSTTPSFPVVLPAEQDPSAMVQAPAPPTHGATIPEYLPGGDFLGRRTPEPAGTTGTMTAAPATPAPTRPQTVRRPQGLNGVFIEYGSRKWFVDGPAVEYSADRYVRVGEYRGFAVYRRQGDDTRIYVPALSGSTGLLAVYRSRS